MKTAKVWAMPEWMEPYRRVLEQSAYGLGVEELMNDHGATFFNNEYRAAVIVGLKEAVSVLTRLHKAGMLSTGRDHNPNQTGE